MKNDAIISVDNIPFEMLYHKNSIAKRIDEIAEEINGQYKNTNPTLIVVLKGAFVFASALIQRINIDFKIDFISISSYKGEIKGDITLQQHPQNIDLKSPVIIIEDIVDTGATTTFLSNYFKEMGVNDLKIASLLFKPKSFMGSKIPDYVGFSIDNAFVIGYGLDYNEQALGLKHIYQKQV